MNEHHEFGDDVILIRISRQITFSIERKRLGAVELGERGDGGGGEESRQAVQQRVQVLRLPDPVLPRAPFQHEQLHGPPRPRLIRLSNAEWREAEAYAPASAVEAEMYHFYYP